MRKLHAVDLTEKEKFRLKVMDAYEAMESKNVRYLCKLMGIHHSTFYRLKKQYKRFNLNTVNTSGFIHQIRMVLLKGPTGLMMRSSTNR